MLCTTLGIGLLAVAFTMLAYGTYEVAQIGVCAGGPQPFEIQRECPPGTGRLFIVIFGSFPVMGGGAALHAGRGPAPSAEHGPAQITFLIFWLGLFGALAFASFLSAWGPDADPGGLTGTTGMTKPAAISVGVLFALMALPVVPILASRLIGPRGGGTAPRPAAGFDVPAGRSPGPSAGAGASGPTTLGDVIAQATGAAGGGDVVGRLERLEALRRSGAVSQAEFERLKRQLLEGR